LSNGRCCLPVRFPFQPLPTCHAAHRAARLVGQAVAFRASARGRSRCRAPSYGAERTGRGTVGLNEADAITTALEGLRLLVSAARAVQGFIPCPQPGADEAESMRPTV
jgi:hypothetical protein